MLQELDLLFGFFFSFDLLIDMQDFSKKLLLVEYFDLIIIVSPFIKSEGGLSDDKADIEYFYEPNSWQGIIWID